MTLNPARRFSWEGSPASVQGVGQQAPHPDALLKGRSRWIRPGAKRDSLLPNELAQLSPGVFPTTIES